MWLLLGASAGGGQCRPIVPGWVTTLLTCFSRKAHLTLKGVAAKRDRCSCFPAFSPAQSLIEPIVGDVGKISPGHGRAGVNIWVYCKKAVCNPSFISVCIPAILQQQCCASPVRGARKRGTGRRFLTVGSFSGGEEELSNVFLSWSHHHVTLHFTGELSGRSTHSQLPSSSQFLNACQKITWLFCNIQQTAARISAVSAARQCFNSSYRPFTCFPEKLHLLHSLTSHSSFFFKDGCVSRELATLG